EYVVVVEVLGAVVLESVAETRSAHTELTLTGPDGELYADEEGSREAGAGRFNDATGFDALVIRTLDPGEYLVHVRGFQGEPGMRECAGGAGAEVRGWVPDRVEVGSTTQIEFDEEGYGGSWQGLVTIPEDGQYTFTASRRDDYSQPVLLIMEAREGLDRNRDLPDLYDVHVDGVAQLDYEIPAGNYVIMVAEGLGLEGQAALEIQG